MTPETKEDRSRRSRRSRAKGRDAENHALKLYRRLWPLAQRTGSATGYVKDATDILGTPLHVQVKHRKELAVVSIFFNNKEVADKSALKTHLVLTVPRKPPLVMMLLEDWVKEQER